MQVREGRRVTRPRSVKGRCETRVIATWDEGQDQVAMRDAKARKEERRIQTKMICGSAKAVRR